MADALQYSCLENPFSDREAWQATVYRVAKSQIRSAVTAPTDMRFLYFFCCGSFALVRVEHEGGTPVWIAGSLEAPSVQAHGLLQPWELWPYQSLFSCLL